MRTVLKLGGSVVTRKDDPETVDADALSRAATTVGEALADADGPGDLVVVHGGGSFGHHHAAAHGVSDADGTRDVAAVDAIHGAMRRLNGAVIDALRDADVAAVPVHPLSVAARTVDGDLTLPEASVATLLGEGFVPVLHGDLVAHAGEGLTVLSGDEIVASLATSLDADRVGLCSTVPGVLDETGTVVSRIESLDAVAALVGESDATDVTGGMEGKVRTLLDLDVPAEIFDLDALAAFLSGESPGTTVDGRG